MRIRKEHSFRSQPVHVRRPGLRIALQHASPVVEIVDCDEQYVLLPALPARVLSFTRVAYHAQ